MSRGASGGARLSRAARERQIIDGAAALAVEHGCLPLPLDVLGQRLGVSKALVYAYFPTQQDLANRILVQHLQQMARAVETALKAPSPREAALGCAEAYFDHAARHGALLHLLLSDPMSAGGLWPEARAHYGRIMRRLANGLRDHFGVPGRECLAALHILAALAEDAGDQVFRGRLDSELGRRLAREMTDGALAELSARLRRAKPSPAAS